MITARQVSEQNANKSATKRQLWALYIASKKNGCTHDFRNDNLTMKQASELLSQLNNGKAVKNVPTKRTKPLTDALETEFIEYMSRHIDEVVATAKNTIKIKSVVETDTELLPTRKDDPKFAFFGYGCGISIINYDKRSKVGKRIKELSDKHRMTTFLNMFISAFPKKQVEYFKNVGFPLQAMYLQDYQIGRRYTDCVASFMEMKGVKNVHVRTFDD